MLEKIKELLGEELSEQVTEKLGNVEIGITNDGSLVPAEKHDTMKAELKATKEQLDNVQVSLKELEGSNTSIEELKEQLKAKDEEFNTFKADIEKREVTRNKTTALTKLLQESGALKSSVDLLVGTFNLDNIQLDKKGNIVDSDELLNPVKEARKELFVTTTMNDDKPREGTQTNVNDLDDQAFFNAKMKKGD